MSVVPESEPLADALEKRIVELRGVYQTAQTQLQQRLTDAATTDFKKFRYGEILKQINQTVTALDAAAAQVAAGTVPAAYEYGADLAVEALKNQGAEILKLNLGNKLHTTAIQAVSDQMTLDLLGANQSIGQNAQRILRATQQNLLEERQINQIIAEGLVEGGARKEVSRALETRLREQLANGQFVTVNGRNFTPEHYAELVVRTRTREAATHGTIGAIAEQGVDLVQISVHENPCTKICQALQGKVFSISGRDRRFPRLEKRPPYHPNCEHVLLPFIAEAFDDADLDTLADFSQSQESVAGNDDYQQVVKTGRRAADSVVKGLQNTVQSLQVPSSASEYLGFVNQIKEAEQAVWGANIPKAKAQELLVQIGTQKEALKQAAFVQPYGTLKQAAMSGDVPLWHVAKKDELVALLTTTDDAALTELRASLAAKEAAGKAKKAATVAAKKAKQESLAKVHALKDSWYSSSADLVLGQSQEAWLGGYSGWYQQTKQAISDLAALHPGDAAWADEIAALSKSLADTAAQVQATAAAMPGGALKATLQQKGFKYWNKATKDQAVAVLIADSDEAVASISAEIKQKLSDAAKKGAAAKKAAKAAEEAAQKAAVAAAQQAAEEAAQQAATGLAPVLDARHWNAIDEAWQTSRPTFTAVPGRADVGGVHRKYFYVDEAGDKWLFKPYTEEFRADADEMAYKVQRLLDPDCVEVRKIELDGRVGSIQKMRTDLLDKFDFNGVDPWDISPTDLEHIQREHVLDWLISQHDGHSEQFIRATNGHVYGIDKGQAFKFFPNDRLAVDYNPAAFGEHQRTLYNDIGMAVRQGRLTLDPAVTLRQIEVIERLSDDEYLDILRPYARARFGRDQARMDRFLRDAIDRKHNLRADFETYYRHILKDPSFRFEAVAPRVQPAAAVRDTRFTKKEVKIIEEAKAAKARGKSVPIDADDIEDQNLLVFHEMKGDQERTVMAFKLRPEAEHKILDAIRRSGAAGEGPMRLSQDITERFYEDILEAVKTINYHITQGDDNYNAARLQAALRHLERLRQLAQSTDANVAAMANHYLDTLTVVDLISKRAVAAAKIPDFSPFAVMPARPAASADLTYKAVTGSIKHTKRQLLPDGTLKVVAENVDQDDVFRGLGHSGKQYRVEFDDGTVLRYTPWSEENLYSQQGQVEITLPASCSPETVERGLAKLETLGVNASIPDPVDQELLYLTKAAYASKVVQDTEYQQLVGQLRTRGASKVEQVSALRQYWANRMGVDDITQMADYNPAGVWDENLGWRVHYRFDITDNDLSRMRDTALSHSCYTGLEDLLESMLSNSGGLVSTSEKMRIGIAPHGMSPSADLGTGGGNYIFVRIARRPQQRGAGPQLYFKKQLLKRMDAISYSGDNFGRTTGSYVLQNRQSTVSDWMSCRGRSSNETIFKNGLSLLENIDLINSHGPQERQRILQIFRRHGITELPDGRAVEDVVL